MATAQATPAITPEAELAAISRRPTPPIVWWALIGAAFLALEAYVMIKWATGPRFEQVASGPSVPPAWMKAVLISWQALGIPIALGALWWTLIRPWRREGRVAFDGLLCVAFFLVIWQDPLSSYWNHWFTYNAYLVNFGSWVNEVPGWISFGEPGAMLVEPILWSPFMYLYAFLAATLTGCWAMRKASERWPRLGNLGLIAIAYVACFLFDVVIEGLIFMPLGFYSYAGGHLEIFPEAYHKFPLHEPLTAGALFAGLAAIRFFKDDQGRTVVERGVDRLRAGGRGRNLLRFAAICGAVNVLVLLCYNLPTALIATHSHEWPRDVQERSYFTDRICGADTNRACPGPRVPLRRGSDSAYLPLDGKLGKPKGFAPPPAYPFTPGDAGPFSGPLY